ncbi:GMC oxidoreductase [Nocardioides sp.]|uniref:GMC oxidoreductase n=1 Tax=Nocardioides sp. TaxID=35761 RepID=UPI002718E9B8|nr:GMC oxidoreductase [Nocardioides sp.]MDO9457757.1 GMC oxidoreductase [Nocardioides sp.]
MAHVSRRALVAGTAATAAAVSALPVAASARVPVRRLRRRVVVVGSGFGGSVASLRLTRAGVPVTLLKQGRAWPTGPDAETFPHATSPDERALFYGSAPELFGRPLSVAPYAGLFNAIAGPTMTIMTGNGYGGGSLTYQGMSLQPARAVFEHEFPAAVDFDEMHRTYYPRVARMLGLRTAPDALIRSETYQPARIFRRNAEAAGYDVDKIPMPIDWSFALRELRGEMKPSYTNGDCGIGVNNGGKHSLDRTYLRRAERTGKLEVRLLHRVTDIGRTARGEWLLTVVRTDVRGRTLETKLITTPTLIMGAGSAGTSRMLVRAGATDQVRDLPDAVGRNWGSNADRIYIWTSLADDFGPVQGGPVVYGSKEWGNPARANTVIQASLPPIALGPVDVDARSTVLVGYGVSAARGRFRYRGLTDTVDLQWAHEADAAIQRRIGQRIKAVAGPASVLLDTNAVVPSTWHPMGGMGMGQACDVEGRVEGQRGLYVLDGALLPGTAAACNPSMTIAALAERAMDRIVRKDVGRII